MIPGRDGPGGGWSTTGRLGPGGLHSLHVVAVMKLERNWRERTVKLRAHSPNPRAGESVQDIALRDPDSCVIGEIVRGHLTEFLERASDDSDGQTVPAFVQRELKARSECGDFVHGFFRLQCDS